MPSVSLGSGIPYPVPWNRILENILLNFRLISTFTYMPDIKEKQAFLSSKGLTEPINFLQIHRPNAPWISQTLLGASWPVDVIPQNVTCTGPIVLSVAPVSEQDAQLAVWLAQAPTILINLGNGFEWPETHAAAMAGAAAKMLENADIRSQVLWKMRKDSSYSDQYMEPLLPHIRSGRVRVERWLAADPSSVLESGHIVASVHHGGSGCYHEAVRFVRPILFKLPHNLTVMRSAGVPQVILPLWFDHYGFAQLSESIGVGVWGCQETSPYWEPDCLYEAISRVIHGTESQGFKERAQKLQLIAQESSGRYGAAREVAKLAGAGRQT